VALKNIKFYKVVFLNIGENMKKILLIIIFFFFIFILILIYLLSIPWLSGWTYRRPIIINNTKNPNTLSNYSVLVTLDTASLISAGKMRSDCGDIRFTDSDAQTLLSYWIDLGTKCNSANTKIWVKVPSIPASSTKTIYIYYGNPSATSQSNAGDLDIWQLREFDEYSSYSPDIRFTKPSASVIEIDSISRGASSLGNGYAFIELPRDWLQGRRVAIYWRVYFSYTGSRIIGWFKVFNQSFWRNDTTTYMVPNSNTEGINNVKNITLATYSCAAGGWCAWTTNTSGILNLTGWKDRVTLLVKLGDGWIQQTTAVDVDWIKILNSDGSVFKVFDFDKSVVMEVTGTLNDYGLYRTYSSPEPTISVGAEQRYLKFI
jgi:hypothetical protein